MSRGSSSYSARERDLQSKTRFPRIRLIGGDVATRDTRHGVALYPTTLARGGGEEWRERLNRNKILGIILK